MSAPITVVPHIHFPKKSEWCSMAYVEYVAIGNFSIKVEIRPPVHYAIDFPARKETANRKGQRGVNGNVPNDIRDTNRHLDALKEGVFLGQSFHISMHADAKSLGRTVIVQGNTQLHHQFGLLINSHARRRSEVGFLRKENQCEPRTLSISDGLVLRCHEGYLRFRFVYLALHVARLLIHQIRLSSDSNKRVSHNDSLTTHFYDLPLYETQSNYRYGYASYTDDSKSNIGSPSSLVMPVPHWSRIGEERSNRQQNVHRDGQNLAQTNVKVFFDGIVPTLRPSSQRQDLISGATLLRRQAGQGRVLVAVLHAYLDESNTHAGAQITCSAGYVFTHEGCKQFYKEWNPYLLSKGLDEFHATEVCIRKDAPEIFNTLRNLIERTTEKGFIRFILSDDLNSLKKKPEFQQFTGSGYSLLTLSCMRQIAEYAKSRGDEVWYFIEAGDSNEEEFRGFIRQIEDSPELKDVFAFYQANLLSKEDGIQLQSADLAAWSLSRIEKKAKIPGFEGFEDWKKWYIPSHKITGYSDVTAQIQAFINRFDGFQSVLS